MEIEVAFNFIYTLDYHEWSKLVTRSQRDYFGKEL
jgi:hypothetical protein